MDVRPIKNEQDYDWALREIERYFDHEPTPGTPEADRFDVLAALIESYEAKRWPIEAPDPVDAIAYSMELTGFSQSDLANLLGSKSRASEILRRKRPLTTQMIFKLHGALRIPAEVLVQPYHIEVDHQRPQKLAAKRGRAVPVSTRRRTTAVGGQHRGSLKV